jgi:hypothetical protein
MTSALKSEWDDHRSTSFNDWLDSMFARRKVRRLAVPADQGLRDRARRASTSPDDWQAAEKDMHVVEAALAADGIIVSCDRKARDRFSRMATDIRELQELVWANPDVMDPDETESWLRAGARPRKALMLGGGGQ